LSRDAPRVAFSVVDTFDVALLRQAADNVAGVASSAWMPEALRIRLKVLATELRGAAGQLVAEETRRAEATR
jgi:hypothetical protein